MLLAIDIGNTNINLGIFKGRRLVKRAVIATKEKNYLLRLKKVCARHKIKDALVCSVVPQAQRRMADCLKRLLGRKPYIIGKEIKVPIKNRYRVPAQVGQDRLVNAYAAAVFYGAPAVVVDSGTAVTFDVVSASGEYLGGLILPGLQLSLDALAEHTALLPKVRLAGPVEFIGRDTKNSILSGVVCGLAAAADELCGRIRDIIGARALVIGTGGGIGLIGRFCRKIGRYDKDLTLKGINLIWRERKQ